MKRICNILQYGLLPLSILLAGCSKWGIDHNNIYHYVIPVSAAVSDSAPLCGSVKGVMLSGKTYTVACDININRGDTLLIQDGVKILMQPNSSIVVKGTLLSLGSREQPNYITVANADKNDNPGVDPRLDPAYSAKWKGILGDTSCKLMVLKWTHIDFGGAAYGNVVGPALGQGSTSNFVVLFQNYKGNFIMEDSWMYGAIDDAVRISGGQVAIMRNTFEKTGITAGECVNVKGGTVGDMGYNFMIGFAENGLKISNRGQPVGSPQTSIRMYNNTFVNGGFRVTTPGSGANIDYEQGAKGMYYNNAIINCRVGARIVGNPAADTANLFYGNTFLYADSISVANQFYPVGYITKPLPTDIPSPTYLPANYFPGASYNGSQAVQAIDPLFINYPLPVGAHLTLSAINSVGKFNFHLQLNSPLIGKGNTGFVPLKVVPVDAKYGATDITPPGKDIGCFQTNGTGNLH